MRARAPELTTAARVARTTAFTLLAVALGAAAHGLTMGASPSAGALTFASVIVAAGAWPLSRRMRSAATIGAAVLATQLALHALFSATMAHSSRLLVLCTAHAHISTTRMSWTHDSAIMLGGHLLAALAAAVWLGRAEAALATIGRAIARRLSYATRRSLTVEREVTTRAFETTRSWLPRRHAATLSGRAPPQVALP